MKAYTRLWTGPAFVDKWAERFESAGYHCDKGTEHLYVWLDVDPDGWGVIPALQRLEIKLDMAASGMYFPAVVMKTREDA